MATLARRPAGPARAGRGPSPARAGAPARASPPPRTGAARVGVETLRARWSSAFFAAHAALRAAGGYLQPREAAERGRRLAAELQSTDLLLQELARDRHLAASYVHLSIAPWAARRLLGLPSDVDACVFNLDGVLVGSAALHLAAWTETFDEFISRRAERTGGHFVPFHPRTDYRAHIHGKPRLDGVRAFLASRGIRLPEGEPGDAPGAETVHGLANRKNEALQRLLRREGLSAFEGSRRYLETARDAEVRCAVVSASANTAAILDRTGLAPLIEARIDGDAIVAEGLRPRPAPDIVLAACRRLDVDPAHTAVFETTPAGVAAGRAAGFRLVVAVDRLGETQALRDASPDLVVSGLPELLDRKAAA
ncbi:MAG TPA: HAD-IA family hydrolase [Gaiellaceae bacterium]|nr:HAD-IA family hydrolase [Gaiellaceae bacterium]